MKDLILYSLFSLIGFNQVTAQVPVKVLDEKGQYRVRFEEGSMSPAQSSVAARSGGIATIVVSPGEKDPSANVMVTIELDNGPVHRSIEDFTLFISTTDANSPNGKSIFFDRTSETTSKFTIPVGGLQPDTKYYVKLIGFAQCSGRLELKTEFKTGKSPDIPKKVLLVIDKQYENDPEISKAITRYKENTLARGFKFIFEDVYISSSDMEKKELYEKIRTRYYDPGSSLAYLFFIGNNANANTKIEILNPGNNSPANIFHQYSLSVYAKITSTEFFFDDSDKKFVNRKYRICAGSKYQNRIVPIISQSNVYDVSFGAIVPTRSEEGKAYILAYFNKLEKYYKGEITFEKRVLFADTYNYDGSFPAKLENAGLRWKSGDTVNVAIKYPNTYHGLHLPWTTDFLKKMENQSYEALFYVGHGSPSHHYFGIGYQEVSKLNKLDVLLLDFGSCNVADVSIRDYLAGVYLNQGNALVVSAYSDLLFTFSANGISHVWDSKFGADSPMTLLSTGMNVSDAYRYSNSVLPAHYLFGDPLLSMDSRLITASEPSVGPIKVYPNPGMGDGLLSLEMPGVSGKGQLEIIDMLGKRVYLQEFTDLSEGKMNFRHHLKAGAYVISIQAGKQFRTYKLLIE